MQHLDDRSAESLVGGQQRFLVDFSVNFLPVGTPGASLAPLAEQVLFQTDFVTVFSLRCPGDALWSPCGAFGRPWACLGATLGVTWAPKVAKKETRKSVWCTLRVEVDSECERKAARRNRM